jgi:flagellar biosynthetic protein FliR
LFLVAPFFGSVSLPVRFKAGLALLLVWLLAPVVHAPALTNATAVACATTALKELAVGVLLGLAIQFVFEASQFAGQILGVQLGFSLVHVLDPQSQADTPVLAMLQQTIVLLLFLALDVHHHLLRGLVRSFSYLPPGDFVLTGMAVSELFHMAGGLFISGVQIAAPALTATMLADLALGFVGKMSPQLPVLFVGLSVKSVLGLVVLSAAVWTWPQFFERAFSVALQQGERILHVAH